MLVEFAVEGVARSLCVGKVIGHCFLCLRCPCNDVGKAQHMDNRALSLPDLLWYIQKCLETTHTHACACVCVCVCCYSNFTPCNDFAQHMDIWQPAPPNKCCDLLWYIQKCLETMHSLRGTSLPIPCPLYHSMSSIPSGTDHPLHHEYALDPAYTATRSSHTFSPGASIAFLFSLAFKAAKRLATIPAIRAATEKFSSAAEARHTPPMTGIRESHFALLNKNVWQN